MSHMTKIKTQITNRDRLVTALNNRGYNACLSNEKIKDYYGHVYDQNMEIVFIPNKYSKRKAGISFNEEGVAEFHADNMDFGRTQLNEITVEYSKVTILETASDFGYCVDSIEQKANETVITLNIG